MLDDERFGFVVILALDGYVRRLHGNNREHRLSFIALPLLADLWCFHGSCFYWFVELIGFSPVGLSVVLADIGVSPELQSPTTGEGWRALLFEWRL